VFALAFLAAFLALWGMFYALLPLLRYAGRRVAHSAAKLSIRFPRFERVTKATYLPVLLIIVAGAAITMWAGDAFLDVAELVHDRSPLLQQIDFNAHTFATQYRSAGATSFFVALSTVGGPVGIGVILTLACIVLAIRRRWRWAAYLAVTAAGGGLLDMELKLYFARARPALAEALRQAHGYSFPSGHAMGSTVAFGAFSYLALRIIPRTRWKSAALALFATLILFVSLSRVYLGVHWVSDVGAGIVAGTLWVTATTVAYETFRRVRAIRAVRARAAVTPSSGPPTS
jgi:undecaprenyl-diphosphatase